MSCVYCEWEVELFQKLYGDLCECPPEKKMQITILWPEMEEE